MEPNVNRARKVQPSDADFNAEAKIRRGLFERLTGTEKRLAGLWNIDRDDGAGIIPCDHEGTLKNLLFAEDERECRESL